MPSARRNERRVHRVPVAPLGVSRCGREARRAGVKWRMNLRNQHRIKDELGGGLVGAAAKFAATRLTRRSLVCRLGYAAAALMGAEFLVANGPRAVATVKGTPPCFDQKDPCGANGKWCSIASNAAPCDQMKTCAGCLQASGCPVGTAPEDSWTACCICVGQANLGWFVKYVDCCATALSGLSTQNLPLPCKGCFPQGLSGTNCVGANHTAGSWCSTLHPNYVCTQVQVGGPCFAAGYCGSEF